MSRPATPVTPATTHATHAPEMEAVGELLDVMRTTLNHLGQTFDSLGEQTAKVASLGPTLDSHHQIQHLQRQLVRQEKEQEARIEDVRTLLDHTLKEQIAEHLRDHVFRLVHDQIESRVAQHVEMQLRDQIPKVLREQIAEHQRQLAEVRRSLHNAEARRANALLRSTNLSEPLRPLLRPDGAPSALFPRDLAALFGASTSAARALLRDFDLLDDEGETRERHLNRFMAHIGVAFQMVPAPAMPSMYPLITQH